MATCKHNPKEFVMKKKRFFNSIDNSNKPIPVQEFYLPQTLIIKTVKENIIKTLQSISKNNENKNGPEIQNHQQNENISMTIGSNESSIHTSFDQVSSFSNGDHNLSQDFQRNIHLDVSGQMHKEIDESINNMNQNQINIPIHDMQEMHENEEIHKEPNSNIDKLRTNTGISDEIVIDFSFQISGGINLSGMSPINSPLQSPLQTPMQTPLATPNTTPISTPIHVSQWNHQQSIEDPHRQSMEYPNHSIAYTIHKDIMSQPQLNSDEIIFDNQPHKRIYLPSIEKFSTDDIQSNFNLPSPSSDSDPNSNPNERAESQKTYHDNPIVSKFSKESKQFLVQIANELILFITSEASERCMKEDRRQIRAEDIFAAMERLDFERYSILCKYWMKNYQQIRDEEKTKKKRKNDDHSNIDPEADS